jgi:hypothetical protein
VQEEEPIDERFARSSFNGFLLERHDSADLRWQRGADPPDYVLQCPLGEFDVEVTQVMEGCDTDSGVTTRWYQARILRFARNLQATAEAAGELDGAYVLHLDAQPDLDAELQAVRPRFLDYIRATAQLESAGALEHPIRSGGLPWSIEKYGRHRNLVAPTMGFGGGKWQGEVLDDLRRLIGSRHATKSASAARPGSTVLLLIDAYLFGDNEDWIGGATVLDGTPFHTVARCFGEYECQILASRVRAWRKPHTNQGHASSPASAS